MKYKTPAVIVQREFLIQIYFYIFRQHSTEIPVS